MCLYSAKKKRDNNVGKNNSIDDKLQRKKSEKKKKDIVIYVLVCMEYGRQLDTYISHDDIRLDLIIFEKFIDIIIIKLEIIIFIEVYIEFLQFFFKIAH
jgi:hypothetical protein